METHLPLDTQAHLLLGHIFDVLTDLRTALEAVKTREGHTIIRADLAFLQEQVWHGLDQVNALESHVAHIMKAAR